MIKNDEPYDHLVKVLLIGESGVGKTCLLQRFNKGDFLIHHLTTIAIDFKMKILEVDGVNLKMQIWDTAGQERFNTLTSNFFKTAQGIIVVYSVADELSFQGINKWLTQIKNVAPKDVKVLLVGNKTDLENERMVSVQRGEECANKFGLELIEASAFNGTNVNLVFDTIGRKILEGIKNSEDYGQESKLNLDNNKKRKCCN